MSLTASLLCAVLLAKSTTDTGNEDCTYDGLRLDKGSMPNSKGKVNSVPEDFSGLVVCVDPDTKYVYEQYQLAKGERVGLTKQYDRRTGRLSELIPYEAGVREGCVKRYDSKTGRLVFEFCVEKGQPHGLQKSYDADTGHLTSIKWVRKRGDDGEATSIQFNSKGQPTSLQCGPQTVMGSDDLWCGRGGRSGEVTLYSDEGWPSAVVSYRNTKQHGWERRYHRDGHLLREERFEDGKSVEERRVDGKGASYMRTRSGESETETVYFEESKKPRLVIERKQGKTVKEVAYFANGKVNYEKVAKVKTSR
jgi:antitoxin component YwqK of YwqJK toxin-antitoxin module